MIKLPPNKDLTSQFLKRQRGVPGYLISIKISYTNEINLLRVSFTDGCSCCGQSKYIVDVQSPSREDLVKSIKKFRIFSYSDASSPKCEDKLWVNSELLGSESKDINDYNANPQKIIFNYSVMKKFLEDSENNQNIVISENCKVRIRKIGKRNIEFFFNHNSESFDGDFSNFHLDKKRTFGVDIRQSYIQEI